MRHDWKYFCNPDFDYRNLPSLPEDGVQRTPFYFRWEKTTVLFHLEAWNEVTRRTELVPVGFRRLFVLLTRKHLSLGLRKNHEDDLNREFFFFVCVHRNLNVGPAYGYERRLECGCLKRIEQERWRRAKLLIEANWQATMQ